MYVSRKWNIILKSDVRIKIDDCTEYITQYKNTDRLIFEWNQIKLYEDSTQYANDTNKYHLTKEVEELTRKNADLTKITNIKVTKELELDKQWVEADAYQRQLYLLKNMRWLQQ